jgi:hypothetical protein
MSVLCQSLHFGVGVAKEFLHQILDVREPRWSSTFLPQHSTFYLYLLYFSNSFRKYLSNIPGKHEIKELQKTAILGTAHILRKVLM